MIKFGPYCSGGKIQQFLCQKTLINKFCFWATEGVSGVQGVLGEHDR